ncbi:MAG: ATP-binding protein [Verrucomicrobiota bacterium]|jgi:signal transduction histidine kinase
MNFKFKLQLAVLGLAVGLLGALIVAVTLTSQQQAEEARARLGQVDLESMRIADRFKDKLRYANDQMRRYSSGRDRAVWAEFLKASEELKVWIGMQAPNLTPGLEREVLKQMGAACAVYMQKARDLHDRMETTGESSASLAEYHEFSKQARHLNDLGLDLARIHYELRNEVLAHANRTLTRLSLCVLGLVGLLFVFGLTLAARVYRDIIAPLRVKLVESQALAERHEKLASLGLLAAGVAHEVRNPLTAIKAALFIQQKKFPAGSPERGDIELVEREILRLERIVTEFLQFARPADPELATIPADQLLAEVQALLTAQLAKDGIQLLREARVPMRIKVDPGQIKQVLINLVQNAADSMDGGGTITLRARQDRKRLANGEADVVVLEVADTGKGIPPEVEARLFDPFFTTKDSGTGLGLSIAARMVEKQGGCLQYQTQVNRGTTFGIVLPEATA